MVEVLTDEMFGGERKPAGYKFIQWELRDGQARLTLNRPPHNVLNAEMLTEMAQAFESLHDRPDVKVVLLQAAKDSKSFCGGVDLPEYTTQRVFQMLDSFARLFRASLEVGKPIVVAVNGPALGGGCELAAFGDMVIATPKAKFSQPEIKLLGMFPPFATSIFPYIIGPKRAMEMLLTGEPLTAEEALSLRLVNRLVPEAELEKTLDSLLGYISQHSAPVLAMAKKAIYEGLGMSLTSSLKHSHNLFLNELYKLEDTQEGLRAIAEKRKPQWKNR
ncbi:MAG: enoyl-CoA hydratase/isomerase family protein [Acidobacteria bacterium]|nr:enoyl-CoA hydratase/isomerase family protein [Acidobacteriota bacterium]